MRSSNCCNDKGIIGVEELETRREVLEAQLQAQYKEEGQGVALQDPEQDKYAFADGAEIDCTSRIHLCKAACCRLPFALSQQDVREGIVFWNLGQPYLIEHGKDGYCTHMDARYLCCAQSTSSGPCPVVVLTVVRINGSGSILIGRFPNPAIEQSDWPYCLMEEKA